MNNHDVDLLNSNSQGWLMFVRASFAISVIAMGLGTYYMPVEDWIKGYIAMGSLLLVASTFTLAKTLRDEFEAKKILYRINEARAEKAIQDSD
jgi:hypothetical protein